MVKEWIAVLLAADAAAKWHVHQRRKGTAQEPYLNHLLEVASLVAQATNGEDADLVIAALLHDAAEDQEVPSSSLRAGGARALPLLCERLPTTRLYQKKNGNAGRLLRRRIRAHGRNYSNWQTRRAI